MRKTIFAAVLIVLSCVNIFANVDNKSEWNFKREIVSDKESGYKYIMLDKDIYRETNSDLSDLIIMDSDDEPVPYFIENAKSITNENAHFYNSELTNSFYKNDDYYADFALLKTNDKDDLVDFVINKLTINIETDKSFAKDIKVYGSHDDINWTHIENSSIYQISSNVNTNIQLDKSKYKYYRIIIVDNIERLEINSIIGHNINTNYEIEHYTDVTNLDYEISELDGFTEVNISNTDNLKLNKLHIVVEGDFNREFKLYEAGELLKKGIITKKDSSINIADIDYHNSDIKIVITNDDDKPIYIDNINAEFFVDELVFYCNGKDKYTLHYGKPNAVKPKYDIVHKKNDIKYKHEIFLGEITQLNEVHEAVEPPNYKLILNVVIVLISLSLIIVLGKNIKK
ncbi:MAG TPA: hypothetical protein GXZ90_07420 [Clostridiales bacterium]|nr:hypothetical protein [Clostridiales bacterium]